MFKTSRSSSRAQSNESLNRIDDDLLNDEEQSIHLIMDNKDKHLVSKNKEEFIQGFNDVNSHFLGKTLIDMATKTNKVLSKSKDEPLISIHTLVQAFREHLAIEKTNLATQSDNIKQSLINNRLNFYKIAPTIQAPSFFSPIDVLGSTSKCSEVMRIFPKGRDKFSGIDKQGPEIKEFLYSINLAQTKCRLSQSEFLDLLANSCTRDAHIFVRALVDEKSSPEMVYHKMCVMYDHSIPPEIAKQLLLDYRIKKSENLAIGQAFILDKASIIAKLCISDTEKRLISDFEAIQALPRSLPTKSRSEVNKQYRVLMMEFGRQPTFIELISSLESLRMAIDEDIKANGAYAPGENLRYSTPRYKINTFSTQIHDSNKPRFQRYNQSSSSSRNNNSRNYTNYPRQANHTVRNQRPTYTVHNLNSRRPFNNNFMNKNLSCLLCGRQGHTAAMQCYQLRDSQGKNVSNVTPSQEPCQTCLKQNGKRLFHPEKYCFIKNKSVTSRSSFPRQ